MEPPDLILPLQKRLWNLLENPNSWFAAKIVAVVSCLFVVASTLSLIFSTLPVFQIRVRRTEHSDYLGFGNWI